MNNKIIKIVYEFMLFLLICWGGHAWFTWSLDELPGYTSIVPLVVIALIAFLYKRIYGITVNADSKFKLLYLVFFVASCFPSWGITTPIIAFLRLYPVMVLLNDVGGIEYHISFVSKILATVLIPGIVFHLFIITTGIEIPSIPIQFGDLETNYSYLFWNYGFMIRHIDFAQDEFRFQSVFLEPGYMGTLLSFLLYALRYDVKKWYVQVILVALALSFSLAGYVTSAIGYTLYLFSQGLSSKRIVWATIFFCTIYIGSVSYNNGDNFVNNLIIERLQYDSEKGISGNNRFSDYTEVLFYDALVSGQLFLGKENIDTEDLFGAGYMRFLLTNGIFSALMYLLFYISMGKYAANRRYANGLVFLIVITFVQAGYPGSFSWIVPFAMGVVNDRFNQFRLAV